MSERTEAEDLLYKRTYTCTAGHFFERLLDIEEVSEHQFCECGAFGVVKTTQFVEPTQWGWFSDEEPSSIGVATWVSDFIARPWWDGDSCAFCASDKLGSLFREPLGHQQDCIWRRAVESVKS